MSAQALTPYPTNRATLGAVLLCVGCFSPANRQWGVGSQADDTGDTENDRGPSAATIAITPPSPTDEDTLTCTILNEAVDPDGDPVSYRYSWSLDGADAGLASATVSSSLTSGGQAWMCEVTPTDGTLDGPPATASVTIAVSDADGDGYTTAQGDCDDTDPAANPGEADDCSTTADDNCDGSDNNQDSLNCTVFYADNDGDGYGDAAVGRCRCYAAAGEVGNNTDCDDSNPGLHVCGDYTTTWGGEMILIAAGTFTMGGGLGDPESSYIDHEVTLSRDFWIGETEVTRSEWESWSGGVGWAYSTYACTGTTADCPTNMVSWYDVAQYANALSTAEGLTPCYLTDGTDLAVAYRTDPYSCPGYRLPTEAEWEYAGRAGEDTTYSGSNTAAAVAWTYATAYSLGTYSHEVAMLAPNAWGLHDLSGNVYEWVNDWYDAGSDYYASSPPSDPSGPAGPTPYHGARGGYWGDQADWAEVSARGGRTPSDRTFSIGFRLARSIVP